MNTYVYNEVEVQLTGRKAEKAGIGGKKNEVVEITPVDQDANGNYKKWVPMAVLFKIQDQEPKA